MINDDVISYKLYLIQRGTFLDPSKRESERPFKGVIDFDYMGSAEFEFGSVNRSFGRIVRAYREDRLKLIVTDLVNLNGVPLNIFYISKYSPEDAGNLKPYDIVNKLVRKPDREFNISAYIKEIRKYIDGNNPEKVSTYYLKENITLHERFYKKYAEYNREDYIAALNYAHSIGQDKPYIHRDDFWMDIQNDTMMFFSAQDRINMIFHELDKYK